MSHWIEVDAVLINLDHVRSVKTQTLGGNDYCHKMTFHFDEESWQQFAFKTGKMRDKWYALVKEKVMS